MEKSRGFRPAYLVVLALALPPLWKAIEVYNRPGPRAVSASSVAAGRELFNHEWKPKDPLTKGDGLGPVFNARSCVECHSQAGPGGGGPNDKNVTVYGLPAGPATDAKGIPPIGVVHFLALPGFQENLAMVAPGLPGQPRIELTSLIEMSRSGRIPSGVSITQRNTPALFGDGLLDSIHEDELHKQQRQNMLGARLVGLSRAKDPDIRGRVARLPDGRLGRFGWKAEFATLQEFVKAACANELGLANPGRDQATPLGRRDYKQPNIDLTDEQCIQMTDFIRALAAPAQVLPADKKLVDRIHNGERQFNEVGCADCHTPNLGSVSRFYSDLLLHDLGADLASSTGYYGAPPPPPPSGPLGTPIPVASEWKTPALWGVADSAPYLHDGRAKTLAEAIAIHGGEAAGVTKKFNALAASEQADIIAFLKPLRAPGATGPASEDHQTAPFALALP
jgi:CxxC motif-containing protein (DUF1111 family)